MWGGYSIRHNDSWTLKKSRILELLDALQRKSKIKYCIYGDSAYFWSEFLKTRYPGETLSAEQIKENMALSTCRECIEWDYGDVQNTWQYLEYTRVLHLINQPIAKLYTIALILSDAKNTLVCNQTSKFFNCMPPTLEEWLEGGPRKARLVSEQLKDLLKEM